MLGFQPQKAAAAAACCYVLVLRFNAEVNKPTYLLLGLLMLSTPFCDGR
jgi:hypothetical protein